MTFLYLKKFCASLILILLIVSCDSSGGSSGGGGYGGNNKIDDEYIAEEVLAALHYEIENELVASLPSTGSYTNEIINGTSGSASLTGTKQHDQVSTSSYVSDTRRHNFTIVFKDYEFDSYKVSGTVEYYYYGFSSQSGAYNFSSSYNIYLRGSNISLSDSEEGISDTITFYSDDDDSQTIFYATLTPSSGEEYSFKYWL